MQTGGEFPIYWQVDDKGINFLLAFDREREQPQLIFKPQKRSLWDLPKGWRKIKPIYDRTRPEFQGQFISAIAHGGHLWLLRREPEKVGSSELNGPEDFRLVRIGLDGGEPIVIPLRYEVPQSIRELGDSEQSSLERPVINCLSLTATESALFFGGSGYRYGGGTYKHDGIPAGGDPCPALLYIKWDEINDWLERAGK